jgi:hypothetical protein
MKEAYIRFMAVQFNMSDYERKKGIIDQSTVAIKEFLSPFRNALLEMISVCKPNSRSQDASNN